MTRTPNNEVDVLAGVERHNMRCGIFFTVPSSIWEPLRHSVSHSFRASQLSAEQQTRRVQKKKPLLLRDANIIELIPEYAEELRMAFCRSLCESADGKY